MLTVVQEVLVNKVYPKQLRLKVQSGTLEKSSCPTGKVYLFMHVNACMLLCPNYMSFFSQGFRDNSSFVLIHKIALSLHATGFSNCLFPTFLFILAMNRGTEMHHHIVLPQGFLAVTQQHPQDHYSPFYPRPEFFIWSHCLLLNSHL